MYAVVKFLNPDPAKVTFEAVPLSWISKDRTTCYGPINESAWNDAILKEKSPGNDWVAHPILVKSLKVKFSKAQKRRDEYLYTSSVESSDTDNENNQPLGKRKRISKMDGDFIYDKANSSSQKPSKAQSIITLERPGPVCSTEDHAMSGENFILIEGSSCNQPVFIEAGDVVNNGKMHQDLQENLVTDIQIQMQSPGVGSTRFRNTNTTQSPGRGPYNNRQQQVRFPQLPVQLPEVMLEFANTESTVEVERFETIMLRQQAKMEQTISFLSVQVGTLNKLVSTLVNGKGASECVQNYEKLPLQSQECVEELDKKIETPKGLSRLISQLALTGGNDVKSSTERIMRNLMTDSVACLYNWKGINRRHAITQKMGFKNLNLPNAVIGAVRSNFPDVTNNTIELIIMDWLKYAKARMEGRRKADYKSSILRDRKYNSGISIDDDTSDSSGEDG